jgi:hypothetical protein
MKNKRILMINFHRLIHLYTVDRKKNIGLFLIKYKKKTTKILMLKETKKTIIKILVKIQKLKK